jgi:hypothetical protein
MHLGKFAGSEGSLAPASFFLILLSENKRSGRKQPFLTTS